MPITIGKKPESSFSDPLGLLRGNIGVGILFLAD